MSVWSWLAAPYEQGTTNGDILTGLFVAFLMGLVVALAFRSRP